MPASVLVHERQAAARCAYCRDPLPASRRSCACGAAYHRDCFVELGRCGTLGCFVRPEREDRARTGCCASCGGSLGRALPWERSPCRGCGTSYHLGCRSVRVRCVAPTCHSGAHDGWGGPRPRAPAELDIHELLHGVLGVARRWPTLLGLLALGGVAVWACGADPVLSTVAAMLVVLSALHLKPSAEHA